MSHLDQDKTEEKVEIASGHLRFAFRRSPDSLTPPSTAPPDIRPQTSRGGRTKELRGRGRKSWGFSGSLSHQEQETIDLAGFLGQTASTLPAEGTLAGAKGTRVTT